MPDEKDGPEDLKSKRAMELVRSPDTGGIMLRNLADLMGFAAAAVNSGMVQVPGGRTQEGYGQAALLIQTGAELGLGLMASVRLLYVQPKSHRIEVFSEGALALIRADPIMARAGKPPRCLWWRDWIEGTDEDMVAKAQTHRRGTPEPDEWSFSVKDARRAGLWARKTNSGQDTPWVGFGPDMLLTKVRSRLAKKVYQDVLGGLFIEGDLYIENGQLVGLRPSAQPLPAPQPEERKPPAGPDPMLQLNGPVDAEIVLGPLVAEPGAGMTHAEADRAIVAQEEQGDLFRTEGR